MRWEELLQSNPSVAILLSLSDEARSSLRDNLRDAVSQLFDDDGRSQGARAHFERDAREHCFAIRVSADDAALKIVSRTTLFLHLTLSSPWLPTMRPKSLFDSIV